MISPTHEYKEKDDSEQGVSGPYLRPEYWKEESKQGACSQLQSAISEGGRECKGDLNSFQSVTVKLTICIMDE